MYVGVSARYIVDVEALNMAESVGNVVRHKKAPIVAVERGEGGEPRGYRLRYVPVVSGASIAHGFQRLLARLAAGRGLPVCPLCSQGVFVKHGAEEVVRRIADRYGAGYAGRLLEVARRARSEPEKAMAEFERLVIENCVVEDVGGFLYPGAVPVKRTSRFHASYMVPSRAHLPATGVEALFHVRYDPLAPGREGAQAIYHVEAGTAVYTVSLGLDLSGVGCYYGERGEPVELPDAAERRRLALSALALLVGGMLWGAKRSRFNPLVEVESVVVTVSHPLPFNPAPGHSDSYIADTVRMAGGFVAAAGRAARDAFVDVYYYVSPRGLAERPSGPAPEGVKVSEAATPAEAVLAAEARLGAAGGCG